MRLCVNQSGERMDENVLGADGELDDLKPENARNKI